MKFRHLDIPRQWTETFTKYPHGLTIFEALVDWTSQVNKMVDNVNDWNEYLDGFVDNFEFELRDEVQQTITKWQNEGLLDDIIESALETGLDTLESHLAQTTTLLTTFEQLENESDSEFINRVLTIVSDRNLKTLSLPKDTVFDIDNTIYIPDDVTLNLNNSTLRFTENKNGIIANSGSGVVNGVLSVVDPYFNKTVLSWEKDIPIQLGNYKNLLIRGVWYSNGGQMMGTGIDLYGNSPTSYFVYNNFENIRIRVFEYGIRLRISDDVDSNGRRAWVNSNTFDNIKIDSCRKHIDIDGDFWGNDGTKGETSGNIFTRLQLQNTSHVEFLIRSTGTGNYFDGYIWDEYENPGGKLIIANEKTKNNVFDFPSIERLGAYDVDTSKNIFRNYKYNYGDPTNFDRHSIPYGLGKTTFSGHQDNFLSYLNLRYSIEYIGKEPTSDPNEMFTPSGKATIWHTIKGEVVGFEVDFSEEPIHYLELIGLVFDPLSPTPDSIKITITDETNQEKVFTVENSESYYQLFDNRYRVSSSYAHKMRVEITAGGNRVNIVNLFGVSSHGTGQTFLNKIGGEVLGNLYFNEPKRGIILTSPNGDRYRIYVNDSGEVKAIKQ